MSQSKGTIKNTRTQTTLALTAIGFAVAITAVLTVSAPSPLEIIAVFLMLLALPVFFIRPKWAFLFLLALRPAMDFVGQNVSLTFENLGTININSIVGVFIFVWGSLFLIMKRVKVFSLPVFYPLAALSLVTLISISQSEFFILSFGEWIRISNYLIFFLLGYVFTNSFHDFTNTVKALFISTIVPILLGIYQLVSQTGLSDEASSNRLFGTFAHPALFGQFLAFTIILVVAAILITKQRQGQLYAFLGILVAMLILTYTRGAWIFAAMGIIILGITFFRKRLYQITVGTLMAILVLIGGVAFLQSISTFDATDSQLVVRVLDSTDIDFDSSVAWRFRYWGNIAEVAPDYVIGGYGAGTFLEFSEEELNTQFDAHNDYLEILVEVGIFGLIAFVGLLITLIGVSVSNLRKSKNRVAKIISVTLIAEILGIVFVSFFDNFYQNTTVYWLFAALVGSYCALYAKHLSTQKRAAN